ncbi:MAG: EAL domain-containing protein [Acidimicrobiales bacterium]
MIFTAEATVSSAGEEISEVLGWSASQACDRGMGLVHPTDRLAFGALLKMLRGQPDGVASLEVRFASVAGEWVPARVVATNRLNTESVAGILIEVDTTSLDPEDSAPDGARTAKDGSASRLGDVRIDAPEPFDIGILLKTGSSIIDLATGPVQAKLGCHPDALSGLHIWEIVHRDDESDFSDALAMMRTRVEGEVSHCGAIRLLAMSGAEQWFDVAIIRQKSGLVIRARDTSTKLAVDRLDPEPDTAVVFLDADLVVTYASESFEALIGRPASGAVGQELLAVVHPTDRGYAERRFGVTAVDSEIHSFIRVSASSGGDSLEWRWVEVVGRNYLDDSTVGMIALCITAVSDVPAVARGIGQPDQRGTFSRDNDGRVGFVNNALLAMAGSQDAVELARKWPSLMEVSDEAVGEITEIARADGSVRYLRTQIQPVVGADGSRTGDVGVVEDVTRFVETGDLLESLDGDRGSVIILDQAVGVSFLANELANLVGLETRAAELSDVFTAKSAVVIRTEVWSTLNQQRTWAGQLWLRKNAGQALSFHAQLSLVAGSEDDRSLASGILTPLGDAQERTPVDHTSLDSETEILSRTSLIRRMERALARRVGAQHQVVLALIGLDGYDAMRNSNPTALSSVVRMTAERLRAACRHDETVARVNEATFAVFSQRVGDAIDVEHLADRISDSLASPFLVDGLEQPVSLTVGIAQGGHDVASVDEFFSKADLALRRAQSRGRTRVEVLADDHNDRAEDRSALEEEFRAALVNDELDNVYQTMFSASGGSKQSRFEALVRWNSPKRGIIGAADVLRLADDVQLAGALGHRVLDRALAFVAATSRSDDTDIFVHVNLSASQLRERGFVSRLDALLRLYHVESSQLGVEIPEPVFLLHDKAVDLALRQLHDIGVRIVIDDVTGRLIGSSSVEAQDWKIDRRLIEGVGRDSADTAQVAAIAARAREHEISITAVGVATERQRGVLTDLGVDWLQGFLLERPLRPDEIGGLGRSHSILAPTGAATKFKVA